MKTILPIKDMNPKCAISKPANMYRRSIPMQTIATSTGRGHYAINPFHLITKMITAIVIWNKARATRAMLSKLSDHELEDIGLSRADISQINR